MRLSVMLQRIAFAVLCCAVSPPLQAQRPMSALDSARHALDRLAYGAAPGEIGAIARDGVLKWIDTQLGYDDVGDPGLEEVERSFDVLHVSIHDMQQMLQNNQVKALRARAASDSIQRRQLFDQLRTAQRSDRRSLQGLLAELQSVTMVRAVESEHQLDEILTDFWANHFNVYLNKGQDRAYFADYLQRTIRGHALGSFESLLIATARSPAMLFYLDQAESVADGTAERLATARGRDVLFPRAARAQQAAQRAPRGINENYARELMELHTLGVDGGYTQQDVINVARILTGWGIDRREASFTFRAAAHDAGAKTVMGRAFPAGHGEDEGVRLLRILASDPATIHHVSAELCARFVNDVPPDGCIDDAVRAWKASGGEIRGVMHAIVHSPDFWAAANVDAKVKTPLEFVVSAVRAVGAIPDSTPRLAQRVAQLGEPLFQHQTPDGYGERQQDWVNSGALLARMNFAMQLAAGRVPGVALDLDRVIPVGTDHAALVDAVDSTILGGAMTEHTHEIILKEIADVADPRMARELAVGFALGGPEFQRQ